MICHRFEVWAPDLGLPCLAGGYSMGPHVVYCMRVYQPGEGFILNARGLYNVQASYAGGTDRRSERGHSVVNESLWQD